MAKNNRGFFANGFISCDCKTPYAESSMMRTNIATTNKLIKTTRKRDTGSKRYPHSYKITKGTRMQIGTSLNDCKCSIFSGKDRSRPSNRKSKSFVRYRNLKGINSILVSFT